MDQETVMGERTRLVDGAEVIVRPIVPEDRERLVAGFERLGERSRYERSLGSKAQLSGTEVGFLTDVDHHDHEALCAVGTTGEGLGVARFVRCPDLPVTAEAAVAVVDDWQGRGLGRLLLERLAQRARSEGIERFPGHTPHPQPGDARALPGGRVLRPQKQEAGVQEIEVLLPVGAGVSPELTELSGRPRRGSYGCSRRSGCLRRPPHARSGAPRPCA